MRRSTAWSLLVLLQVPLLVWTAFRPWTPGLGAPAWHHNASLAFTLLSLAGAAWWFQGRGRRILAERAHLAFGVLTWTVLAVVSGILILYLKQDLKDWGLKDWAKWWHILWSWYALVYFVLHTAVNWAPLANAWRRLHALPGRALMHDAALVAIVVAIPVTWGVAGRAWFTDANYIPLTLWTWLAFLAPFYAGWWYALWAARRGTVPGWASASGSRIRFDVWLVVATVLANASGLPLTYAGTKDTSLKYVAKYWHTWPSILMAILIFAHTIQFWSAMRRHQANAQ